MREKKLKVGDIVRHRTFGLMKFKIINKVDRKWIIQSLENRKKFAAYRYNIYLVSRSDNFLEQMKKKFPL